MAPTQKPEEPLFLTRKATRLFMPFFLHLFLHSPTERRARAVGQENYLNGSGHVSRPDDFLPVRGVKSALGCPGLRTAP